MTESYSRVGLINEVCTSLRTGADLEWKHLSMMYSFLAAAEIMLSMCLWYVRSLLIVIPRSLT